MNQLARIWSSLTNGQRISLLVVPVVVCAIAFGLVRWKHESDFRTLSTGLAPEDASAVTQKLRESAIEFRMDELGSTIQVPSSHLADARLALAGAGLPRSGRIGFELFDKTNLGSSDFTEQVNYRRALEGELERTVATLSDVAQARIHITFAKDSVFLDSRQPAKATAVLKIKGQHRLSQANVSAVANLIASAVDGLAPEAVAIVDSNGRLLNRPRSAEDSEARAAESNLDYRHQLEADMLAKINTSLEPLLGAGKFRAGLNVECDFTASEENEESYDSGKSAVLQSQTTEESNSQGGAAGTPGTASNLPRPPAREAAAGAGMFRKTENMSYQPGKSVRHTVSPRGTIRRVSAAVLVDQTVRWDGAGAKARRTLIPPSTDVMKAVREVVASVTGFTEQRGDQIVVETLPFESTLAVDPPSPPAPPAKPAPFDYRQPLVLGAGAASVLLITGFMILTMRRSGRRRSAPEMHGELPGSAGGGHAELPAMDLSEPSLEKQLADNEAEQIQQESEVMGRIKMPANTRKSEVLVKHIREAVQKDPVNAANVLRTWVSDAEVRRTT